MFFEIEIYLDYLYGTGKEYGRMDKHKFCFAKLRRVYGDGAWRQVAVEICLTRTCCRKGLAGSSGGVGVDHADSCTNGCSWRSSRKVTALRNWCGRVLDNIGCCAAGRVGIKHSSCNWISTRPREWGRGGRARRAENDADSDAEKVLEKVEEMKNTIRRAM